MYLKSGSLLLLVCFWARPTLAQMPFYTDDTVVTEVKKIHVEVFDEIDGLQSSQFPDYRQNTANAKINFSPTRHVELDIDVPYIGIDRTLPGPRHRTASAIRTWV